MTGNGSEDLQLPENFSEKELRWSAWWVENREKVRRFGLAALVILDVALVAVVAWGIIDWLALSGLREEQAIRQLTSQSYGRASAAADVQEITVGAPLVFSMPGDRYDFVADVSNPNPSHWVEIEYAFSAGGQDTAIRRGFILPGETKRIVEVGAKVEGRSSDVRLKILTRAFHRLDRHAIPDYAAWSKSRLAIVAVDSKFTPPEPGATVPVGMTSFTLVNQTAYSYYDVGLNVFVYRGESLQGANRLTIDRLKAGERRPAEIYWYQNLQGVTRIEVVPDVNILDSGVYQAPGV